MAPPMPPELLAAIPRWTSRPHYLQVIDELAVMPEVRAACKQVGVAVATWRRITRNDAYDADTATGLYMSTSQQTAAHRVGRRPVQVRRARAVSQAIGIMVEMYRGYSLSYDQRIDLITTDHDHPQRGVASVYAMTICPTRQRAQITKIERNAGSVFAQVKHNVHLPTFGGLSPLHHLLDTLTITPAVAVEDAETAPPPRPKRKRCAGTDLARQLADCQEVKLFQNVRPGRLAPQLGTHEAGGWHGNDLARALEAEAARRAMATHTQALRAWGLLKALLDSIDPIFEVFANTEQAQTPPMPPEPCGIAPCDGHGWINLPGAAAKCPHCPPGMRSAPYGTADDGWTSNDPLTDEPLF